MGWKGTATLASAAKAGVENDPVIAAVNRHPKSKATFDFW
jgi:hypothetical protein